MSRIIDEFGRKRCQKKRKDVDHKLLYKFFQKYFVAYERFAVKNSFNTYVWLILIESISKKQDGRKSSHHSLSFFDDVLSLFSVYCTVYAVYSVLYLLRNIFLSSW